MRYRKPRFASELLRWSLLTNITQRTQIIQYSRKTSRTVMQCALISLSRASKVLVMATFCKVDSLNINTDRTSTTKRGVIFFHVVSELMNAWYSKPRTLLKLYFVMWSHCVISLVRQRLCTCQRLICNQLIKLLNKMIFGNTKLRLYWVTNWMRNFIERQESSVH